MSASTLKKVANAMRDWITRFIILLVGMAPASCHYHLTAPALWAHQSSYAFEAWLLMWIVSLGLAGGAIYVAIVAD